MAVAIYEGSLPHIYWIDIKGDGMFTECAVMKRDKLGNIFFFPVKSLDKIDKDRLSKIVQNRNAKTFELWDLMSTITLNNGVNALAYFHQLVEMLTPTGKRIRPQEGVVGTGMIDSRTGFDRQAAERNLAMAAKAAADAAAEAVMGAQRNMDAAASKQKAAE